MKFNLKVGAVILLFFFLITIAFAGIMLWFGLSLGEIEASDTNIYRLNSQDYVQIVENSGSIQMNPNRFVKESDYQSQLLSRMYRLLIPAVVVFLILLIAFFLFFWLLLKGIQKKRSLKIAQQMNSVVTDDVLEDDPVLAAAYQQLKQKFDNQMDDYKRLNSYLSHEQKNAIAILRTNLELSENVEYLKNLDDIADSIDDILTLSENASTSPVATVDVSVICAEVYDNYRKVNDNISFEFDGEEDTEILARSRWIYRAVANLLDNAIKYGENKPITLSVHTQKGSVVVVVKDNGIGIPPDKQEAIFHEHYRINELNKDGYGIGLSLVSHVCDLCGGFIMVESAPGEGSAFYLSFPQKLF